MVVEAERVVLAAFLTEAILAGGNGVAVRFSNRELAPLWGAGVRFSLGAVILIIAAVAMRRAGRAAARLPRGRALAGALLYGLLNFGIPFGLIYFALLRIHAGFGQTVLALVPRATLLLAVLQRQERVRVSAVVGSVVALAGIAGMSEASWSGSMPPLSLLAILGAVVSWAEAAVLVRSFPPVHPVVMNAVGMATGAAALVVGSMVAGEGRILPRRPATWGRSRTWSCSARWSCSCSTRSSCGTGRRRGQPTRSSSLRWWPSCSPRGWIANRIGRITPQGAMTEYTLPRSSVNPEGITAGPDGNVWFTGNVGFGNTVTRAVIAPANALDLPSGPAPTTVAVSRGATLVWLSLASGTHSVQDSSWMGLFSGPMLIGKTFAFRFIAAGTYRYTDPATSGTGAVSVPIGVSPKSGTTSTSFTVTLVCRDSAPGFPVRPPGQAAGFGLLREPSHRRDQPEHLIRARRRSRHLPVPGQAAQAVGRGFVRLSDPAAIMVS